MVRMILKLGIACLFACVALSGVALGMGDYIPASRLAFISERDGNLEIYVAHIGRGLLINATRHRASDNAPQWSPDGEWLGFQSGRDDAFETYLLNTSTWRIRDLEFSSGRPLWSPDGKEIAVHENNPDGDSESRYRIYDLSSWEFRYEDEVDAWIDLSETMLTEFGVLSNDGRLRRIIQSDDEGFPRFLDVEPSSITGLGMNNPFFDVPVPFSLSPDWAYFAASNNIYGDSEIYLVPTEGGDVTNLTNHPAADTEPVWSPDGRYIAFISYRDGNTEVYVVNVETGETDNISNHHRRDYAPIWAP